jgi:hypothetical protein
VPLSDAGWAIDRLPLTVMAAGEFLQPSGERREAFERRLVAEHFAMIASRISRDYRAGRDITYHAALSGNTSLLTYREVVRQACLPGQDHVILYNRAASDPYLRHDQTAASNANVMGHLHQVVYLGACSNHRVVDPAAVDRGVGSNLDVVADHTSADVGNSFVPRITSRIPKTRRADPGTGV